MPGFDCSKSLPNGTTLCEEICGDGLVVGKELCDDGIINDNKGCQVDCKVISLPKWTCKTDSQTLKGECKPKCKDGFWLEEE